MSVAFDHRQHGSSEQAWEAAGLERLPRLAPPLADSSILVVAAHPDDESLGAGGLIADAAACGATIRVLVATDGEASHPKSPTCSSGTLAGLRRAEVLAAVAALAPSAVVEFLGLPDGHLDTCLGTLTAAVAQRSAGCTHVLTPWQGDRHPDHEACAAAARAAAGRPGVEHWQYPIWAWHWAEPERAGAAARNYAGLPWQKMRRLDLSSAAVEAKWTALACHLSQHSPLSDAPGDEAILLPHMLAHFNRGFETFVVEPVGSVEIMGAATSVSAATESAYFDALYKASDDPWGLNDRFYERRKRNILLASLPREHFVRAFEPGCATGLLTAELLTRCRQVLAWDGAGSAVRQARERVDTDRAIVEQRRIPMDWPEGTFDLIVLSEVGYYCSDLTMLARRVRDSLAADGVVVACHWKHPAVDHPHSARAVHKALDSGLHPIMRHHERDFLLELWSVSGESVASAEGILAKGTSP